MALQEFVQFGRFLITKPQGNVSQQVPGAAQRSPKQRHIGGFHPPVPLIFPAAKNRLHPIAQVLAGKQQVAGLVDFRT
jgi:hypothetical protein